MRDVGHCASATHLPSVKEPRDAHYHHHHHFLHPCWNDLECETFILNGLGVNLALTRALPVCSQDIEAQKLQEKKKANLAKAALPQARAAQASIRQTLGTFVDFLN